MVEQHERDHHEGEQVEWRWTDQPVLQCRHRGGRPRIQLGQDMRAGDHVAKGLPPGQDDGLRRDY